VGRQRAAYFLAELATAESEMLTSRLKILAPSIKQSSGTVGIETLKSPNMAARFSQIQSID
jgi:hypothetical protein